MKRRVAKNHGAKNVWYVSRQHYYYSGEYVVEIAFGGIDYSGADMLANGYNEEGEYVDPREAVEAAIAIRKQWKRDQPKPKLKIGIAMGSTGGMGLELEGGATVAELRAHAKKAYESVPKCDKCGEIIEGDPVTLCDYPDEDYCSENCADRAWEEIERMNQEDEDEE